jgi:ATP-dependent helicase/DNAse subunit B
VGHAALESTLRELADAGERLDAGTLERATVRLRHHLREHEARHPISTDPRRRLAERGRLEADLVRLLEHQVGVGSAFAPRDFELTFGVGDAPLPAVDVGGLTVRGRIDRVDRSPDGGEALIIDYKGRSKQTPATKWLDEGLLQAGLYARALERLEAAQGTRVVGALYQPVGAEPENMKARGWVDDGADAAAGHADRLSPQERDALLDAILDRAREVVDEIRRGVLRPRPERCSWDDSGCAHPSICRCES